MKILTIIARVLLGLMFVVFGSDAFLHFMPMPPLPDTPGGRFIGAMLQSGYIYAVALCQIAGGALLLIGRFVPLGLVLLGPVVANIVLYHIFMDFSGMPVAICVTLFFLFLLWSYRAAFAPLFRP